MNVNRPMKYFTFADAYGLSLIARNPNSDWTQIRDHLSEDARKIADELIHPGHAPREIRSAAADWRALAQKARDSRKLI